MKCICLTIGVLLVVLAATLLTNCAYQRASAPQIPPESTVILGPEPKIPKEFFGCWEGTLTEFDTAKSYMWTMSDESLRAAAAQTTYQFCFNPRPDGTGQLDLKKVEVQGHEILITRFDNRVTMVDPEQYRGSIRNHVTGEAIVRLLWLFPLHIQNEIYADEDLQMKSPNVILVRGRQLVVMGGSVIGEMTFHTDFHRVAPAVAQSGS
jgi:hypothetical protein